MNRTVRILVLGGGRGQVPIIQLLHQYHCFVIVVSPKGNYPGIELADEVIELNVKDKEEILRVAKEKEIDGIVTDQLDAGVLTAAYVAEQMDLRGIGFDIAQKFTNKAIMRQEAHRLGICIPKNLTIAKKEELINQVINLQYPLIIKPVDSAASRGIYKVYSLEELLEKFDSSIQYSKCRQVIIEEFIEGKEFVVDAYTHNGKTTNLIVGFREYFHIDNIFIPKATIFLDANSANTHLYERIKAINTKLVEGMGLQFGITHAEYLYNQAENRIYLVEIAARGGGVFISSDLIPMACGVNANELLVKDVLGLAIENKELALKKGTSAYFCYLIPEGEVVSIHGTESICKLKNVKKAFFDNIAVGMRSGSIQDKSSRKGPILIQGRSVKSCYKTIKKVKELLKIKIQTKDGLDTLIWE